MKQDSPSPAAHLVRFGVATSRGAYRTFLSHVWLETSIAQNVSALEGAKMSFETALELPDTQFPLGTQPWTGVLAKALRRIARLFADEGLAIRFASAKSGAPIAPVLNAFAPLCAEMGSELESSGFEIHLSESESALRSRLAGHLPSTPVVPELGTPGAWLPDLFAGMMHAAIWREIVAEPTTLKLAATASADFLGGVYKDIPNAGSPPTATIMEQVILVFAPKAVDYGLRKIVWKSQPSDVAELEAKALPYLRAAFSRETPLAPVVAQVATPTVPTLTKAVPPRSIPAKPKTPTDVPALRPVPKATEPTPEPSMGPIFPPDDDDDEIPMPTGRSLRWLIGAVGGVLVSVSLIVIFGNGGIDFSPSLPDTTSSSATPPNEEPRPSGPERMIVAPLDPLAEPEAVTSAPVGAFRLFEKAQAHIDSAARARRSGDNRQACEDLSQALLIFKQDLGEQRWNDERYLRLRSEYRSQLGLMELSDEQISAVEDIVGAREQQKPTADQKADLAKVAATFAHGDEELARGHPKAAAEAYELALRTGFAILGGKHTSDRAYQSFLSRYIDFLIAENLEPDEMNLRIGLVKLGKKPKPLPDKKPTPETDGLGLPKL